jgi:hypothetical protein
MHTKTIQRVRETGGGCTEVGGGVRGTPSFLRLELNGAQVFFPSPPIQMWGWVGGIGWLSLSLSLSLSLCVCVKYNVCVCSLSLSLSLSLCVWYIMCVCVRECVYQLGYTHYPLQKKRPCAQQGGKILFSAAPPLLGSAQAWLPLQSLLPVFCSALRRPCSFVFLLANILKRQRLDVCHMKRRIHLCHMRRRIHVPTGKHPETSAPWCRFQVSRAQECE